MKLALALLAVLALACVAEATSSDHALRLMGKVKRASHGAAARLQSAGNCENKIVAWQNKWGDNDCLRSLGFNDIFGGGGDGDDDGFGDGDGFGFNDTDYDSGDDDGGINLEALGELCACKKQLSSALRDLLSIFSNCFEDEGDSDEADEGIAFLESGFLDKLFDFMCIKNGDRYCLEVFSDLDSFTFDVDESDFDSDTAEACDAMAYCGCCCASAVRFAQDLADIGDLSGIDDSDVDMLNETYSACDLAVPRPCIAPGDKASVVRGRFTISVNVSLAELGIDVEGQPRRQFVSAFCKDVAAPLSISPADVQVVSITEGSILVDYLILVADQSTANTLASSLGAASFPLDGVKALGGDFASVEVSSKTAESATVTNSEGTTSPAALPGLSAAAALFALLVAAFFH